MTPVSKFVIVVTMVSMVDVETVVGTEDVAIIAVL